MNVLVAQGVVGLPPGQYVYISIFKFKIVLYIVVIYIISYMIKYA